MNSVDLVSKAEKTFSLDSIFFETRYSWVVVLIVALGVSFSNSNPWIKRAVVLASLGGVALSFWDSKKTQPVSAQVVDEIEQTCRLILQDQKEDQIQGVINSVVDAESRISLDKKEEVKKQVLARIVQGGHEEYTVVGDRVILQGSKSHLLLERLLKLKETDIPRFIKEMDASTAYVLGELIRFCPEISEEAKIYASKLIDLKLCENMDSPGRDSIVLDSERIKFMKKVIGTLTAYQTGRISMESLKGFEYTRRISGDGSCGYRTLDVVFFEQISRERLVSKGESRLYADRMISVINSCSLIDSTLRAKAKAIINRVASAENLEEILKDRESTDVIVEVMRKVAAWQLRKDLASLKGLELETLRSSINETQDPMLTSRYPPRVENVLCTTGASRGKYIPTTMSPEIPPEEYIQNVVLRKNAWIEDVILQKIAKAFQVSFYVHETGLNQGPTPIGTLDAQEGAERSQMNILPLDAILQKSPGHYTAYFK